MPRLVKQDFHATGQDQRDAHAETLVFRVTAHLDAFAAELICGRCHVVAQQRELMIRVVLGRVDAELGGRQREDQPAVAGVDVLPAEHFAELRAQLLRLGCVEQYVCANDRHTRMLDVPPTKLPAVRLRRGLITVLVCALLVAPPAAAASYRLIVERDGLRVYGPASERSWGSCPRGALVVSRVDVRTARRAVVRAVPKLYAILRRDAPHQYRIARATGAGLAPGYARGASLRTECGERIHRRTIVVDVVFPRIARYSASLSQATFFVSHLRAGWVIWYQAH